VIDAKGNVVGIHTGKIEPQPGGGKIVAAAINISELLPLANAPAPAVAETPAPRAAPVAAPAPAGDANEAATKALTLAKNYIASKRPDIARTKLQKLIETYPNTPAAADAQKLLQSLPAK